MTIAHPFPTGIGVQPTVRLLRIWSHIEKQMIRATAAWFLCVPEYETKIGIGHQLWAHAERTNAIRNRLKELRGGHHEANIEPALSKLTDEIVDAPSHTAFMHGWSVVLKYLQSAYRNYLEQADPAANAAEIRLLHPLLADSERSTRWLDETLTQQYAPPSNDDTNWADYIQNLLDDAQAAQTSKDQVVLTRPHSERYHQPNTLIFDDRIQRVDFETYEQRMELPFEHKRIAECQIFFNEFYAAGLLATIILDAWNSGAPWECFHDLSHHFWDEVRHAEFGVVRLTELGVAPSKVNLALLDAASTMPFLHRLCYLTLGLEVYFMPRKRPRVKRYAEAGDERMQLFSDVDWSDEGNHVQYGKRWVNYFLEDDVRSVEEVQDEIRHYLSEAGLDLPDGKPAPY